MTTVTQIALDTFTKKYNKTIAQDYISRCEIIINSDGTFWVNVFDKGYKLDLEGNINSIVIF